MTRIKEVRFIGLAVFLLGLLGVFVRGHLLGIMNVDSPLDAFRIILGVYMISVGYINRREDAARVALYIFSLTYIGLGVYGTLDRTIGGLLPSGLTEFDLIFHLGTGAVALLIASSKKYVLDAKSR